MKITYVFIGFFTIIILLLSGCGALEKFRGIEDEKPLINLTPVSLNTTPPITEVPNPPGVVFPSTLTPEQKAGVSLTVTINETQKIKINPHAVDPDGDTVAFGYSKPLDENGEWQTKVGDAGEYIVTVTAKDAETAVPKKILIVVRSLNRAPVMGRMDSVVVNEGDIIKLSPVVVDPEGDPVTISFSGWMNTSTRHTTYGDAGEYIVVVTVSDGKLVSEPQRVRIVVNHVNRPPKILQLNDISAIEGDTVYARVVANDPDGDNITFSFSDKFDNMGVWVTKSGDAGVYRINVTADDGHGATDTAGMFVVIEAKNKPPVLNALDNQIVNEDQQLTFAVSGFDPDGDKTTISAKNMPIGARFDQATNTFTWTPSFDAVTTREGTKDFRISFTIGDGKETTSKDMIVTVLNVNRPPTPTLDVVVS